MAKEKKPVQDIPEEENVITPEEFEQLEKKEKRGRISLFPKEKPKQPPITLRDSERRGRGEDDVFVSVEKIQAKLETMEGLRQATEEKISRLSEEIGELRSSILEKDKTFNQVETGFERVREIIQELQPKKIRAELDKREDEIERLNAKFEASDTKVTDVKKKMDDVVGIMDKIKDLRNVVAVSENISRKMAKIEEEKKETTKIAAKVESMFSEITEKMTEFHNYRDKIEFSSESMHDMMKSLDMLEVKVENALTKDDAKKMDDRMEQLERDLSDKIQLVRDIVDDLVTSLKQGGVKDMLREAGKTRIDEINRKFSQIENYEKGLKETRDELSKLKAEKDKEIGLIVNQIGGLSSQPLKKEAPAPETKKKGSAKAAKTLEPEPEPEPEPEGPESDDLSSMMERCHANIDSGSIQEARKLYAEILSLYEKTKDTRAYSDAEQAYGQIKRLYYRLQIYH